MPTSRQMGCPRCAHEHLWLDCDFCDCHAHEQTGIYTCPFLGKRTRQLPRFISAQ